MAFSAFWRALITGTSATHDLKPDPISHQGRRLIDATNQPLQPKGQSASLRLREKTAQLALPAVRLNREPARVQARFGAAEFNLRPMPREHVLNGMLAVAELHADVRIRNRDRLAVMPPGHAHLERPPQERHFETGKRQDGPKTPQGHEARDHERDGAHASEEQQRGTYAERTVGADFDALRLGLHCEVSGRG
jgi:hypothetical protein